MFRFKSKDTAKKTTLVTLTFGALFFTFFPNTTFAAILDIGNSIQALLFMFVNAVFGNIAGIAGILLNYSINDMVIGFGKLFKDSGLGYTIDSLWVVIRDLFNLTFIFGLVYIGLKMIFDSSNSDTKRMLVHLILAALLVNFSLFISKFVVDFSNIAAAQLISVFPTSGVPPAPVEPDISGAFTNLMGIGTAFDYGKATAILKTYTGAGGLGFIFGTLILYLVMTFVFLGGALLLMIRFVVLNLYMLLSPVMFIGWVFPAAANMSREYWSGFLGRAFFAPAYILMLYISFKVLSTFNTIKPAGASFGTTFGEPNAKSVEEIFPSFILTAIFLIASLVVAQKMGANGSGAVMSAGRTIAGKTRKYALQKTGSVTSGAVAAVGRNSVGRVANRIVNSDKMQKWVVKDTVMGRTAMAAAKRTADSSFDARKIGGIGKGLGIGEGRKGGYATIIKERNKAEEEYVKNLGETKVYDDDGNYLPGMEDTVSDKVKAMRTDPAYAGLRTKLVGDTEEEAAAAKKAHEDKVAEVNAEKTKLEAELATLKTTAEANPGDIVALEALEAKKKSIANLEVNTKAEIQKLAQKSAASTKKASDANDKFLKALKSEAENSIKYQNQLAYIEAQRKKVEWRNNIVTLGGRVGTETGGATAVAGGLAAGALTGGVGALAVHSFLAAGADKRTQTIKHLEKTYGRNGRTMGKKKQKEEDLTVLKEALKDSDKKDDASDDTKDT